MIASGLQDNWSQVRYAASQACRGFYQLIGSNQNLREKFDIVLVPRLCFNRHYMAEGVKLYN